MSQDTVQGLNVQGLNVQTLQRLAALLGWPGWMGLLMLAMATALWAAWLPALQAEHDEALTQVEHQRQQLNTLSQRLAQQDAAKATGPQGDAPLRAPLPESADQAWAALWPLLPERDQMLARQTAILKLAEQSGIRMESVQFQGAPLKAMPQVWRQQISVPVQASYPALVQWLGQVRKLGGVSMDALEVSRDEVMSDQVKGRVSLSIWLRPKQGAQP